MDYINAFWVGGLICALVQILMEKTKMMPGRIMVLLVSPVPCSVRLAGMNLFRILREPVPAYRCLALEMC